MQPVAQYLVQIGGVHPIASLVATSIAVAVPLLYYFYNHNLKNDTYQLEKWGSYEIEEGVRCNKGIPDGKLLEVLDHKIKGKGLVKTVYDCFMHGIEISNDGPCLGHLVDNGSRYEWYSYSQVRKQASLIGRFLRVRGIQRQQCIGIYAANSCEWVMAMLASVFQSIVSVPLYETLGLESIRHTINEVEMPAIFCDSVEKLKRFLDERKHFPHLRLFILLHDNVQDSTFAEKCKAMGIAFLTWSKALAIGAEHPEVKDDVPKREDIFLVQYTSGTTGLSKGVILTHGNMVGAIAGAAGCAHLISRVFVNDQNDSILLYMPLPHAYAQNSTIWFFYAGGKVAFSSGNVLKLLQEVQLLKPTYFPLVPRIMNRLYAKVSEETKSGLKGWLFWKCFERKRALYRAGVWTRNSIYDWLVFRRLQKLLGGRVRFMTTGSAPIAVEVLEFWRVVFGAGILEAYGQTESSAVSSAAVDVGGGNVGHPTLSCMIRLMDVPELGYSSKHDPPQGEICLKGPNITQGYYKRPELTKEAFTPDGWLLTGDIGEFLPSGALRIIDRRKHIFKLSQGEYIAPEKIESTYVQCPLVAQVFVDGNTLQTYTVAIVVPDEAEAKKWADDQGLPNPSLSELCSNKHVLDAMISIGRQKRLNSLEQIRALHLHPEPFSISSGLLTPTMKNKRHDLRRRFQAEIEALYKAEPMIPFNGELKFHL